MDLACAILPRMPQVYRWMAPLILFLLVVPSMSARVTHVDITTREEVLDSKSFGEIGAYERITGRVFFAVAVANIHNQPIVDLRTR